MRYLAFSLILAVTFPSCNNCDLPTSPSSVGGSPAGRTQVWITPNVCSRDMLKLFSEPGKWVQARSKTNVFKFYPYHLGNGPSVCENNTLTNFINIVPGGAFRWLNKQNPKIEIAIEAASVKAWNCGGRMPDENVSSVSQAIRNIEASGGRVGYVAMDEPFTAVKSNCKQSSDITARQIKYYIDQLRIRHPGVSVGLIEAYPYLNTEEIEEGILAIKEAGANISFLHLDGHRHGALANNDVFGDLRRLKDFCHKENIDFGVIVWGDDGTSNQGFSNESIMTVATINAAIGAPDHIIFQSWESSSGQTLLNPDNLPENQPHTMTWIVNTGLALLGIR